MKRFRYIVFLSLMIVSLGSCRKEEIANQDSVTVVTSNESDGSTARTSAPKAFGDQGINGSNTGDDDKD